MVGLAACGKSLKQLFDEEDRGLLKDPTAAKKALLAKKSTGPSNSIDDKNVSGTSKFSSPSSSLYGTKRSGSSVLKGDKMISGSRRFARDPSAGPHKHCKEGCKHCEEDTYHGDEVNEPHVLRRRASINNINWDNFESSRSLGKSARTEDMK